MSEQIKEKSFSGRTKVIVSRTFGDQNVLEVYTDYVAHKIKEKQRIKKEEQRSLTAE
ncbi:MAG: hypothetical protein GX897_09805 [Clostridiales bacterium]|nr:hypothetical protein [Clostridiales bacterium]